MNTLKTYKIATIILAVVVVILLAIIMVMHRNDDPAMRAQDALASCQSNIEDWNAKYASSTATNKQPNAAAKQELSDILTQCSKGAHATASL